MTRTQQTEQNHGKESQRRSLNGRTQQLQPLTTMRYQKTLKGNVTWGIRLTDRNCKRN